MLAKEITSSHTDHNDEPDWFYAAGIGGVTKIEHTVENYGDHGIAWFNIFHGEKLHTSVAAKSVSRVVWDN